MDGSTHANNSSSCNAFEVRCLCGGWSLGIDDIPELLRSDRKMLHEYIRDEFENHLIVTLAKMEKLNASSR